MRNEPSRLTHPLESVPGPWGGAQSASFGSRSFDRPAKTLAIEWRQLEQEGIACAHCGGPGCSLDGDPETLRAHCDRCRVAIKFVEPEPRSRRIEEPNVPLFNGAPLGTALGITCDADD